MVSFSIRRKRLMASTSFMFSLSVLRRTSASTFDDCLTSHCAAHIAQITPCLNRAQCEDVCNTDSLDLSTYAGLSEVSDCVQTNCACLEAQSLNTCLQEWDQPCQEDRNGANVFGNDIQVESASADKRDSYLQMPLDSNMCTSDHQLSPAFTTRSKTIDACQVEQEAYLECVLCQSSCHSVETHCFEITAPFLTALATSREVTTSAASGSTSVPKNSNTEHITNFLPELTCDGFQELSQEYSSCCEECSSLIQDWLSCLRGDQAGVCDFEQEGYNLNLEDEASSPSWNLNLYSVSLLFWGFLFGL